MRTIKVFVGSADELQMERLELADLIQHLNRCLKPRGIQIESAPAEFLDPAARADELKDCEFCIALYWTKFGDFAKEELDAAYNGLKAGHNPRKLYVYFKDSVDITPELKEFKDSFATKYGHFYCRFENVDTMRLNFLLQFEDYQNRREDSLLKIRDSKVEIDGQPLADLHKIPFCGNNPEYQQLLELIEATEALVLLNPDDLKRRQKLHDLKEKREQMEQSLLDTAKLITKLSYTASSARLTEAIRLFEQGDNKGADAVLRLEDIDHDAETNRKRIDAARELESESREALETNIEEYQLKIKTLSVSMAEGWVQEVIAVYTKATEQARGYISQEKFASLLLDFANFLGDNKQYHLVGSLYNECLDIYRQLAEKDSDAFLPYVAKTLNSLGNFHSDIHHYPEAEQAYQESLKIRRQLAAKNPDAYLPDVAATLNNLGNLHSDIHHYQKAEQEYQESLKIRRQLAKKNPDAYLPDVALSLNNLGNLHYYTHHYPEAEQAYQESLKIRRQLSEKNPDAFLSDVAGTLNNLGELHRNIQHYLEAEQEHQESLKTYRQLAEKNPDAFLPDVAMALNNLGTLHSKTHHYPEAEQAFRDSLKIRRQLSEKNPDAFLPDVAMALFNLGTLHDEIHHYPEAEQEYQESLKTYRQLAEKNPDAFLPYVAVTLNNLGGLHSDIHHYRKAKQELQESLKIRRQLAEKNPDAFLPDVALTLYILGILYEKIEQYAEARSCWSEALDIYEMLSDNERIEQLQSWLNEIEEKLRHDPRLEKVADNGVLMLGKKKPSGGSPRHFGFKALFGVIRKLLGLR